MKIFNVKNIFKYDIYITLDMCYIICTIIYNINPVIYNI